MSNQIEPYQQPQPLQLQALWLQQALTVLMVIVAVSSGIASTIKTTMEVTKK